MTKLYCVIKPVFAIILIAFLGACSTNQATGRNQFTGFLPAAQEKNIGAQEHKKILAQFGGPVEDEQLNRYVQDVAQKIIPHTEDKNVNYTVTLLDSPVVNAFALPGGYVYVTRGILSLANNEAELAAVIAHEIGHVTARHSAERYSASVLTGLGASILSAAIKVDGASQALGLGANLYLSSYSRSQEHEADDLGVRYIARAGYDKNAMASFLKSLEASSKLEAKEAGKTGQKVPNYFSTHPITSDRIERSSMAAHDHPKNENIRNRAQYLRMINGMDVSDSRKQGFIDQGYFVHADLGFIFETSDHFNVRNTPQAIIMASRDQKHGQAIFRSGKKKTDQSIEDYLRLTLLKGDMSTVRDFGTNIINGIKTASGEKSGVVNGVKSDIRIVAFEWTPETVYYFMMAIPTETASETSQIMRDLVFSFRRLKQSESKKYRPKYLSIRVAKSGDTIKSLSKNFPYNDDLNPERFRVLNGLGTKDRLKTGQAYKVIRQ